MTAEHPALAVTVRETDASVSQVAPGVGTGADNYHDVPVPMVRGRIETPDPDLTALERAVIETVCAAELAARVYREWRDGANPLYWSSVEGERLLSLCTEAIAARYAAVDSYLAARAAP